MSSICRLASSDGAIMLREQFTTVLAERDALRQELSELRAERDELLARLTDLTAAVRKTWEAEADVRRLKELQTAERESRDPNVRLH